MVPLSCRSDLAGSRKSVSWYYDRMCVQCVRLGQEEARILLAPLAPSLISQFVKLQADRSTFHAKVLLTGVRIRDVYPGSRVLIFPFRIWSFPSRIHIKEFKYFNPKNCFWALGNMIRVVHPGSGSRFFLSIPDPASGSATLLLTAVLLYIFKSTIGVIFTYKRGPLSN